MILRRGRKRALLTLVVLGSLMFAQAAVALALCPMERGSLAAMSGHSCESAAPAGALGANGCVAHCTADLQQAGFFPGIPSGASAGVVLPAPAMEPQSSRNRGLESPPPGAPPRRILLHSFLI